MKKKLLFSVLFAAILALAVPLGVFAAEAEGFRFAEGEMFEIAEFLSAAPSTLEATVYLDDTENAAGVVLGNYYRSDNSVPAVNFSIEAGGVPTVTLHSAADTDTVIAFDEALIASGKWITVKITLDRTEGAQKALCCIDGSLAQTIEMDSIPVISGTMYQFVLGGDRTFGSEYQSNPNYFKGAVSEITAYAEASETPLFSFDYAGEGNTASLIKDQSGNGYDAVFSKQYLSADELPERIEDYAYSFAVVGDPQYVAHYKVSAYVPMYEWIASQNPEYVIGLGDITDWNGDSEWKAAQTSFDLLDAAGIPHTHIRGNHDGVSYYNTYLPWSKYGYIYDGVTAGAYEENLLNTWRTIEIGDTKWLIIGMAYEPDSAVLKWASGVVEDHPEHNVIIATHAYLDRQGNPYKTQYDGWSKTTEIIWTELADKYSNIVMTLCGHVSSDNVIVKQRENSAGTMVTEMLIDFQSVDYYYDTLAVVTMFHFSEDGKTLQVENYSTDNKAYFKNINQFTVTLDTLDVTESSIKNNGTADYDLTSAAESGTINGYIYSLCGDTLIISGSAENTVLSDASAISAYASSVKKIVIENSTCITELGDSLFGGFTACETVVIPAKLTKIGSGTFGGMTALNTVALYNDYYAEGFAGAGIIDLRGIKYLSSDSFGGSAAIDSVTVYMPMLCNIGGEAQKLLSATAATYYAYPTSTAATFVRAMADDSVTLSYYTAEMTGDSRLTREGTNINDQSTAMFTWVFDDASGKLTLTFQKTGAGFRSTQGFADWKDVWADAVLSIEVQSYASYGKFQTHDNQSTGVFNGYKNLISILFVKTDYYSVCNQWQFGSNDFGMFSDNPKLTSIGMGTLTEGVVDLSKLGTVNNSDDTFDEMFRGCTSITKVILPSVATATNLYTSMFEGCTSLASVTLPSALTTIGANSFKGCTSLKFITIPASVTSIDQTAFDADIMIGTESLDVYNMVTGYGYNAAIDMRSLSLDDLAIERTDSSLAVFLAIGTDVTEYTADALNEKFGDNVTYYVYPTSSGATAVREIMKNNSTVKMVYYPESIYPELTRSGENKHNGNVQFIYSINEYTGLLTITTKTTYGTLRGSSYAGHIFIPWKLIWADAVTAIEVVKGSGGSKIMYQAECTTGIFDNYPNLVSIDLNGYYTEIQNNANAKFGVFENNPKLTTLISSGNVDSEGIYFNALKKATTASTLNKAFRGCTSITKVVLRTAAPTNGTVINANMFDGCINLEEISIPSYITAINAGAFAGCTALKNLVLTNSAVTVDATAFDNTDTKLICLDETQVETINTALAGGTTDAKAVYFAEAALTAEGLAIRESGYNGLRYFYSFDASTDKVLSSLGYTLSEYGVILTSGANADNVSLTFDGTNYITGANNIIKYAIAGGEENGKVLSDNYSKGYFADYSADKTYFAGTVKEFTAANYKSEIYVTAYAIYKDADGNEYIGMIDYADYGSEEYRFASIYDVTLDMYIANAGGIRSRAVEEVAVWSILLLGADVEKYKETALDGFEGVTVTLVGDGNGSYLAFVKAASGTVTAEALTAAKTLLSGSEYSITDYIGITIS